jgi:hypothetical protein
VIDRTAPTQRPDRTPSGYQHWRSLLFLHWKVDVGGLRPRVPEELSLDLHDGNAYVGVVPFLMRGVRPRGCPEKLAFNFLETNVRTYVHYNGQPGVFFFSLEANSRLAVWAARAGWSLPYHHAKMQYHREGDEVFCESRRSGTGHRHHVRYRIGQRLGASTPDTLEHFLLERYLMFVKRKGRILLGQVHHQPYPAQQAEVLEVQDELVAAAGLPPPLKPPCYAHYAEDVDVEVFGLTSPQGRM